MDVAQDNVDAHWGGIEIRGATAGGIEAAREAIQAQLAGLGLGSYVTTSEVSGEQGRILRLRLRGELAQQWAPHWDTTQLCRKLGLDTRVDPADLEREILLAMLAAPLPFPFPSHAELASAVRMRRYIVQAARKTVLSFHTHEAQRPEEYWTYAEGRGFTVRPGKSLVAALQKATQPDASGRLYSFSCYRATEYVILLGIAQETRVCNPELFRRLERQTQTRAIMSGQFHDVFLREYGSLSAPLPLKYFVPGDRTWFRNPDDHSSDVAGYEGSWVFYLGDGLFSNFWKRDRQYTLTSKCLELFHWRHATYRDQAGELRIDEAVVEERVRESMNDPVEVARILGIMLRLREPKGVYVDGGCIDASREYPRWVCPGTSDIVLPDQ
jgi:hypothetical protein